MDSEHPYTYTSTQATNCAGCGEYKHTPLRIDAMGGYVCMTCIDRKLGTLLGEFGYPAPQQPLTDDGLGPLPETDVLAIGSLDMREDVYAYSADAMRAYAAQEVAAEREWCARVAEEFLTKGRSPLGRSVAAAIRGANGRADQAPGRSGSGVERGVGRLVNESAKGRVK